jgi:predicted secreted protein
MSKVILVIDIKDEEWINKDGLKFAIGEAYSPEELTVEEAMEYPFDGVFRSDYLSMYHDVECLISSEYGELNLNKEQIAEIAKSTADKVAEGYVAEEVNNTIVECLEDLVGEYKYFIVGIDGSSTPDPRYWQDRWSIHETETSDEAIGEHFRLRSSFYRDDEKPYVRVLKVITSHEKINEFEKTIRNFKDEVNNKGVVS